MRSPRLKEMVWQRLVEHLRFSNKMQVRNKDLGAVQEREEGEDKQ